MEVIILKAFRDKNTRKVYQPDETVSFTKKRYAEIVKTLGDGFVAEVTAPGENPDAPDPEQETPPAE
jgi:hypothetical protein